ncbi:MAG: hypothetical protein KatS3mg131_3285 [Candidatus Tectimicrobiota bacterium]|nr:MAG: hypothetical protein KatS3mg131_3285 [Candidatus Tectomicrobia bacterium]
MPSRSPGVSRKTRQQLLQELGVLQERLQQLEAAVPFRRMPSQGTAGEEAQPLVQSVVRHLSNVVTVMLGYTELALRNLSPEAKDRRYLEEVLAAGKRMRDLLHKAFPPSRGSH